MPSFFKKLLIYILMAQIIFAGYFFLPRKATAQSPPSPTPTFGCLNFTASRQQIVVKLFGSSGSCSQPSTTYTFTNTQSIPAADLITYFGDNAPALTSTGDKTFWAYQIDSSQGKNVFMVVSSPSSDKTEQYAYTYNRGLYYKRSSEGASQYAKLDSPLSGATIGGTAPTALLNLLNGPLTGKDGQLFASSDTPTSEVCSRIKQNWAAYITKVQAIMGKYPDQNTTNWQKTGMSGATRNALTVVQMISALGLATPHTFIFGAEATIGLQQLKVAWDKYGQGWELSETGMKTATEAATLADALQKDTEDIISRQGKNAWPSNCAPGLLDGNWNITNQPFPSPQSFIDYISAVNTSLQSIIKQWSSVTTSNGQDTCGNFFSAGITNASYMFQVLLCELAGLAHAAASWSMGTAVRYLNAYIGIKYSFEPVKEDTSAGQPVSGGTSPGSTPGTTPGGETPTTEAKPLDLSVKMTINGSDGEYPNYITLRQTHDTGLWAKVKSSAGGTSYNCTTQLSGWNDSARQATAKFQTSDKIPTNWTSIVVYGGTSAMNNAILFRFEIPYPPSVSGTIEVQSQPE